MTYTVKYRKLGSFFWRTVKNVEGDLIGNPNEFAASIRILILKDGGRLELPADKIEMKYSPERAALIKKNAEQQTGAKLG